MYKLLGALLGFFAGGFIGALVGFFIGSIIDRSVQLGVGAINPLSTKHRQNVFLKTVFTLMGKLAKADGHISQDEINHVEKLITRLGLKSENRQQAIDYFKTGSRPNYDMGPLLAEFLVVCGQTRNLKQVLISYLVGMALSDGVIDGDEEKQLRHIALKLGFNAIEFDQLIRMIKGQDHFSQSHTTSASTIDDAYAALGVTAADSDQTIKQAYRSLISKYHPDKLIGQGLPEDMIKEATERSQEIQAAHDMIKKYRKAS